MPPVIRIDDDVFQCLQKQAVPLVDTPNDVLRRLLGLEKQKPETINKPSGNSYVDLPVVSIYTQRRWGLLTVPKRVRKFFPGYKVDFILESDIGKVVTRVTSAPKGTAVGNPHSGKYIQKNLRPWYEKHPELKDGDVLRIHALEPGKRYKLEILK